MALLSSWALGQKNHMGDFFDQNSQSKKLGFLVMNFLFVVLAWSSFSFYHVKRGGGGAGGAFLF
jgi:hypothetical protein